MIHARLNWVDIKITYPNVRYKSGMHLQLDQFTCVHSALCINANIGEMLHHGLYSSDFCCSLCFPVSYVLLNFAIIIVMPHAVGLVDTRWFGAVGTQTTERMSICSNVTG